MDRRAAVVATVDMDKRSWTAKGMKSAGATPTAGTRWRARAEHSADRAAKEWSASTMAGRGARSEESPGSATCSPVWSDLLRSLEPEPQQTYRNRPLPLLVEWRSTSCFGEDGGGRRLRCRVPQDPRPAPAIRCPKIVRHHRTRVRASLSADDGDDSYGRRMWTTIALSVVGRT